MVHCACQVWSKPVWAHGNLFSRFQPVLMWLWFNWLHRGSVPRLWVFCCLLVSFSQASFSKFSFGSSNNLLSLSGSPYWFSIITLSCCMTACSVMLKGCLIIRIDSVVHFCYCNFSFPRELLPRVKILIIHNWLNSIKNLRKWYLPQIKPTIALCCWYDVEIRFRIKNGD